MTAREEFNRMLNASLNPRAAYNALMGLVSTMNSQTPNNPRQALQDALQQATKEGAAE